MSYTQPTEKKFEEAYDAAKLNDEYPDAIHQKDDIIHMVEINDETESRYWKKEISLPDPKIKKGYVCPECGNVADVMAEEHDDTGSVDMKNGNPIPEYETFQNSMCTQCGEELPKESSCYYIPYVIIDNKIFAQADEICGLIE